MEPVASRYVVGARIGKGSFGEIYKGEDTLTHLPVAIKLEVIRSRIPQLDIEARIYHILAGGVGIPSLHFFGMAPSGLHQAMVIDLLANSLEDIFTTRNTHFSVKTVLMLADQMISRLEWMHRHHFMHRDIKPDNFMVGSGNESAQIFLIDFGLSKRFEDSRTRVHIPFVDGKSLTGTARYASINAMRGFEQSRRDDLEALGYVLIYFLKGKLPWQGFPAKTQKEKLDKIMASKMETPVEVLCQGVPFQFANFLIKVKLLGFEDPPEYSEYRKMFRELFVSEGYVYDGGYDWNTESTGPHSRIEAQPRMPENTGSAEGRAPQRAGKRIMVALAQQGATKTVLPVLATVNRTGQGMSPKYGIGMRTAQLSPRRPPDGKGRSILPTLVHTQ
jgi:serine/threonine protein kinase